MITVREALKLALPPATKVVGGTAGLGQEVYWARVVRTQPPAFDGLEAGDVALLSVDMLGLTNDLLPPQNLVRELAVLGVAAMAVLGEPPRETQVVADEVSLPLLVLPPSAHLREVEKSIIRLVLNRRAEMEQRGVQMYRQLAQCLTAGQGIDAIVATLGEITGKAVALQDHSFRLKHYAVPAGSDLAVDGLIALMEDGRWEGEWPQGQMLLSTAPPIARFVLPQQGIARYAAPIIVYDCIVGYVSVVGPETELNEIDRVAVGRAASVCAIEMAKEHAVVEAENRSRGEFIDALLTSESLTDEVAAERAEAVGFDLANPTVVMIFGRDPTGRAAGPASALDRGLTGAVREEIASQEPRALFKSRDGGQIVLLPLPPEETEREVEITTRRPRANGSLPASRVWRRAEDVRKRATRRLGFQVSAGIGRAATGVAGIRKSYREAEQALSIAQRLFGGNRTTAFEDLRIYRLLFPLQGTGELAAFYEETLGRLAEYDAKHSGELIRTLEAFFACEGNLQRAADTLYLHRNTLSYRLERIEEISGLSLRDPEDRLCLQLALKIKALSQ